MEAKTGVEKLLGDYLEGLILPSIETPLDKLVYLGIVLLAFLIILAIWKWLAYRRQPQQIARRSLKQLRKNLSATDSQQNMVAIQLCKILQQGLNVSRLQLFKPQDENRWHSFTNQLESACYSTDQVTDQDLKGLIDQSHYWLNLDSPKLNQT